MSTINNLTESATQQQRADPRRKGKGRYLPGVGEKHTANGILEEDDAGVDTGRFKKAKYAEIPDLVAGERIKLAAEAAAAMEKDRNFIADYDGDATYSAKQRAEVSNAHKEAEEIDKEMVEDMEGENVISAFDKEDFVARDYDSRQRAIMADVTGGGVGTIYLGQRGDFAIARWVLKAKNTQNKARFRYQSATRLIEHPKMEGEWKNAKKFWLYMNKTSHKQVVQKMRDHPQFDGWEITDIGKQPMDLISSDKQIYFHLRRNEEKARIDLDSANPGLYFHSSRGIRSIRSWVDAKKPVFEPTEW